MKPRRLPKKKGIDLEKWGKLFETPIRQEEVRRLTGFDGDRWLIEIEALRRHRYIVEAVPITGAAPKSFIRVYEHRKSSLEAPKRWPAYIAKVGHKLYPSESYTEQLMTRIGQEMGIRVARSRLMVCDGQVRFLSRYFLRNERQQLTHGSDMFSGYLSDEKFVESVGEEGLEQAVITFPDCCEAIKAGFGAHGAETVDKIVLEFVRMIGFDALVGNQDRHLQNWGVVTDLAGKEQPEFSPVYDTARGLFWNEPESQLGKFGNAATLNSYVEHAQPLIGWPGRPKVNHFMLVCELAAAKSAYQVALAELVSRSRLARVQRLVTNEFAGLFSSERLDLINRCLAIRFSLFADAVGVQL